MSIRTKMILLVFSMILLAFCNSIYTSYLQLKNHKEALIHQAQEFKQSNLKQLQQQMLQIRKELLDKKKEYLKSQIQTVMGILKTSYENSTNPEKLKLLFETQLKDTVNNAYSVLSQLQTRTDLSEIEKQELAKEILADMRFGPEHRDYFWINDTNPSMIMHPYQKSLIGKDLSRFTDSRGKKLFSDSVKLCKEHGGGFIEYYWPEYDGKVPQPKLSYVKLFKPWNWIIGTGVYLKVAKENLLNNAKEIIRELRYGKDNLDYFWINDTRPVMIMHPYKPQLEDKSLLNSQDPNGTFLFRDMVKICLENGGGFVEYSWPKYGADTPQPKLSYVALFKPWNWIIGTGVYIDGIDATMEAKSKMQQELLNQNLERFNSQLHSTEIHLRKKSTELLILSLFILLLLGAGLTIALTRQICQPLKLGVSFAESIASGKLNNRLNISQNDEIGELGIALNKMAATLQQRAELATDIAKGDFQKDIALLSKEDTLGIAF
jgi:methyl-accepting chemotaxis protein